MEENKTPAFSRMRWWEGAAALLWIPIHLLGLPLLLMMLRPELDMTELNFLVYAIGAGALGLICIGFLRRDFEPLCDRFLHVLGQILLFYCYVLLSNMLVAILLNMLPLDQNPNNEAIMDLADADQGGKIVAMTVLLAPVLEELMFRAGLFGMIRRCSRVLAYVVCILVFSAYHVWAYALDEPIYWLLMLQYVPVTFLLCRLYEKTQTIWSTILLHMLINGVSMWALSLLRELGL